MYIYYPTIIFNVLYTQGIIWTPLKKTKKTY